MDDSRFFPVNEDDPGRWIQSQIDSGKFTSIYDIKHQLADEIEHTNDIFDSSFVVNIGNISIPGGKVGRLLHKIGINRLGYISLHDTDTEQLRIAFSMAKAEMIELGYVIFWSFPETFDIRMSDLETLSRESSITTIGVNVLGEFDILEFDGGKLTDTDMEIQRKMNKHGVQGIMIDASDLSWEANLRLINDRSVIYVIIFNLHIHLRY